MIEPYGNENYLFSIDKVYIFSSRYFYEKSESLTGVYLRFGFNNIMICDESLIQPAGFMILRNIKEMSNPVIQPVCDSDAIPTHNRKDQWT